MAKRINNYKDAKDVMMRGDKIKTLSDGIVYKHINAIIIRHKRGDDVVNSIELELQDMKANAVVITGPQNVEVVE